MRRGYHHGNLKEVLIEAALSLIRDKGPAGFTFAEAARYVRLWSKFSGMDDFETADRFLGAQSAIGASGLPVATAGMGFLAGCGCFGEEIKQLALAGFPLTTAH